MVRATSLKYRGVTQFFTTENTEISANSSFIILTLKLSIHIVNQELGFLIHDVYSKFLIQKGSFFDKKLSVISVVKFYLLQEGIAKLEINR